MKILRSLSPNASSALLIKLLNSPLEKEVNGLPPPNKLRLGFLLTGDDDDDDDNNGLSAGVLLIMNL